MACQDDVGMNPQKRSREFSWNVPAERNHFQHQDHPHSHSLVETANTPEISAEVTLVSYWVCRACLLD